VNVILILILFIIAGTVNILIATVIKYFLKNALAFPTGFKVNKVKQEWQIVVLSFAKLEKVVRIP